MIADQAMLRNCVMVILERMVAGVWKGRRTTCIAKCCTTVTWLFAIPNALPHARNLFQTLILTFTNALTKALPQVRPVPKALPRLPNPDPDPDRNQRSPTCFQSPTAAPNPDPHQSPTYGPIRTQTSMLALAWTGWNIRRRWCRLKK